MPSWSDAPVLDARARILEALVQVVYERGYAGASVSAVCARAKVSRGTFYDLFDSLEDCFLFFLDESTRRASALISVAFEGEEGWLDGVRQALAELLCAFDREPLVAYVLLVEAVAAGPSARERRECHIAALTTLVEERWGKPEDGYTYALAAAGVMASLLGVLHSHFVTRREEPLVGLLGPLMGLVAAPYLDRLDLVREVEHGAALARELLSVGPPLHTDGGMQLPELLRNPRAHRARGCLIHLARHPGASNRELGRAVGIASHTHISTLLARLAGLGLLIKHPGGPGHANAWSLSPYGCQAAHALEHTR